MENKDLVIYLTSSFHMAKIFEKENKSLKYHAEKLYEWLREKLESSGMVEINISENHIFVDKERIPVDAGLMGRYRILVHDLNMISVGGIIIHEGISLDELLDFICIIGEALRAFSISFEEIDNKLYAEDSKNIEIKEAEEVEDVKRHDSVRKAALRNLMDGIYYLNDVSKSFKIRKSINLATARKLVRKFHELISEDKNYLLALTTIKNIGSYTLNHSVNVAILSITMGIALGLNRKDLLELGVAALFHDLGKIDIPDSILNKPDSLSREEFEEIKKHPLHSAERIMIGKGIDEIPIFAVRGILEHHRDFTGGGYPELDRESISLFGRIIRIVDTYDAMTTPRVYQNPLLPREAIEKISESNKFDKELVRVFMQLIGVYPPGTPVLLKNGMQGVTIGKNSIVLVSSEEKHKIEEGLEIERPLSKDEIDFNPASVIISLGLDEDTAGI